MKTKRTLARKWPVPKRARVTLTQLHQRVRVLESLFEANYFDRLVEQIVERMDERLRRKRR